MKKIRLFALVMLGLMTSVAFAQNLRVTGVVTSEEDGQPLPGAIVTVKGTTQGAGTGADGAYTLNNVAKDAVLQFRYTGMQTQEVAVGGKTKIDVVMKTDALQAEEAVVTALGIRKQDRKLGYSVSEVSGDEIVRGHGNNLVSALVGKVAGALVTSSMSSGVAQTSTMTIRGVKSWSKSNEPIFVVDGIILENNEGSNLGWGNQLKDLNQDDFESVTVLKGAAATSLYGSRGANGAVVINTKKGKSRKGIGLEVNYTHSFSQMYQGPFKENTLYGMGDWSQGYDGTYQQGWMSTNEDYFDAFSFGEKFSDWEGKQMKLWYNGDKLSDYKYHNNYSAFFREMSTDNVTASLTGGSDKVTYRLSYGYSAQDGIYKTNDFKRHSIDFSTTGQINDILSVDFSIKYANSKTRNPVSSSQGNWTSIGMYLGYYGSPTADMNDVAENFYNHETYELNSYALDGKITNFFANYLNRDEVRDEESIITKLQLNAKFTDYLDASASITYNKFDYFHETKQWGTGLNRASGGYYGISGGQNGSYDGIAQVHFNKRFINDNFEVDARVMGEIYGNDRATSYSKGTNGGLIAPGVFNFSNSKNPITQSDMGVGYSKRNNMTVGLAAIVNLSWKDQINLELTGRNDWLSTLLYPTSLPAGADNWTVFYPSANLSWIFSDTFHIDPNVVSYGKLRASFAQVGMGASPYATSDGAGGYSQGTTNAPNTWGTSTSILYANPNNSTLPNLDLKPEIQQSIEIGADVRFLNDRIGLDVTYYKNNTFNQILYLSTPSESGVSGQWINAGNIQNQGWEIQIDATPIRSREVRWNLSANWTRNRAKLIELHESQNKRGLGGSGEPGQPGFWAFEGGEYGAVCSGNGYGNCPSGIQRDPSLPNYGKRFIQWASSYGYNFPVCYKADNMSGYWTDDYQYEYFGNVQPDFYWGFNTTLSYKGFDLFVQLDGREGGVINNSFLHYIKSCGTVADYTGRDQEHGGEARTNWKGETVYNGVVWEDYCFRPGQTINDIDVSYMSMREAVDAGIIEPSYYGVAQYFANSWGNTVTELGYNEFSYIALREVTLGYNFPEKWIKHIGLQSARLQFSCRNLCYLRNTLQFGLNPESRSDTGAMAGYDVSGVPFYRYYYLTLNLRF